MLHTVVRAFYNLFEYLFGLHFRSLQIEKNYTATVLRKISHIKLKAEFLYSVFQKRIVWKRIIRHMQCSKHNQSPKRALSCSETAEEMIR
jgi:hypothetical protein